MLLEDQFNPPTSWFITLTNSDETIARTPEGILTLAKKSTTQFMRNQVREHGFRYYLVGEYGDQTKRPHYHAAIFPKDPFWDIDELLQAWSRRGHTSAHPMQEGSAEYLANYTTKKLTKPDDPRLEYGQEPEFRTSSREPAIGCSAIEPLACAYETRSGVRVLAERGDVERSVRLGKRKWPLDPYLLRKLRLRLGIPLKHEERMTHEGYREWHEIPELEKDLPTLDYQEMRHAKRTAARKSGF